MIYGRIYTKEMIALTSFGERIYELRNKNNMSQGDLANKLDVSRQTISKWENNMCLPETEKLVQLSEIFNISIDYILKGEEKTEKEYVYVKEDDFQNTSAYNERIIRKYVGIVLAVVFSTITVALLIMGGTVLAIIPGAVALLGVLLAKDVKHPWLSVCWLAYIVSVVTLPFFTVISPFMIFDPIIYTEGYVGHLIITFGLWLILAILIVLTVRAKKKGSLKINSK